MGIKEKVKKILYITFKEESVEGYILFFLFAIILFKWIIPFFSSIFLGTDMPIYVIVTESMEHKDKERIKYTFYKFFQDRNISIDDFPFKNGLNRGDVVIVVGRDPRKIKVGDVVVYHPKYSKAVLLHRVIEKHCNGKCYFTMKGDNNPFPLNYSFLSEVNVPEDNIKGVVIFRIPYLGIPKVLLVDLIYKIFFGTKPFPLY